MNLLMKDGNGEVVSGYPVCVHVEIRITTLLMHAVYHSTVPSPTGNLFIVNQSSCFNL
jgi:hypothetical protein